MNIKNSCYILELNHSIKSKWQFLDCAAIAVSERYVCMYIYIYTVAQKERIFFSNNCNFFLFSI